jgi:aminopeptidase N
MADRIEPTFSRARAMLSFFSDRLGVPYPWVKYDQTTVDQFVEGGMENASATTLTVHGLQNPALARESLEGSDNLISHEMSHQWFGDLVTTKDWANLWLNEGFATFMAQLWEEHQYGADNMSYSRFRQQGAWFRQSRLFGVPIVTRDFDDSMAYAGNIYGKGGIVLEMLREQMGDDAFFAGLHHYLDTNKYGNVVTADLLKALEETSHTDLDRFFDQWIYGAGAPRFTVTSTYDPADKMLRLNVKQTQQVRGRVGLFHVPIEVAVTTASGTHSYPIEVSKELETFSFPVESAPLMVLFDKGDKILKTVEFTKQPAEWIYQLQKAQDTADRATAAQALGTIKGNQDVIAALGQAALNDRFWGVRNEAITALGRLGGPDAEKGILAAIQNSQPWVREAAVTQVGHFHDDAVVSLQLKDLIRNDPAYRVRAAALAALAQMKAQGARDVLEAAVNTNSPDDVISRAALRAMGLLGDDKSVPTLAAKAAQNNLVPLREAAIGSLGRLDKKNQAIESQMISYLQDPDFDVRTAAMIALSDRGDPAAIAPMEEQLRTNNPTLGDPDMVEAMINRLKRASPAGDGERDRASSGSADDSAAGNGDTGSASSATTASTSANSADGNAANTDANAAAARAATAQVISRFDQLEREIADVNEQLKKIEQALPAKTAAQ